MKITRENFKNIVRETMIEENEYQNFFKKALEKTGKSIPDMSDEEKKSFFNKIDSAWKGRGEKNEELVGNQKKLDIDGDGEIEASDLAALRAGKKKNERFGRGAGVGPTFGSADESVNEDFKSVVGKTIFSDGKGKLFFGYYKEDDSVHFVDYKTWKGLSFKDVSKGNTNKERVIKAILKNQKQFNKKVDFNMWAKKNNPSFEQTMDWFIQNGWINNINKGGIKESVESVNEEEIKWNAVQNAIINFLKANTKILDKRVQAKDTDGVKGGLKSIISGLTNAQRSLKLESVVTEAVKEVVLSNRILNFLEERGVIKASDSQKIHKDLTAFLKKNLKESVNEGQLNVGDTITVQAGTTLQKMNGLDDKWKVIKKDNSTYTLQKVGSSMKVRHLQSKVDYLIARPGQSQLPFIVESVNEEKYTVIDPKGNSLGTADKTQVFMAAKKKGGEKTGHFVVSAKNALKARRALEKFKGDFKNPKLKDIMAGLYESVKK